MTYIHRFLIFLRKIVCLFHMCPHAPASDDTGCWGECVICGKRAGFVGRATLRRACDREYEQELKRRENVAP